MAVWDEFVPAGELDRLRANGFGPEVTVGERPCLLVVDVTLSFISTDYPTGCGQVGWDRLPAVAKLLDTARALDIPRVLTCGSVDDAVHVGGAVKLSRDPEVARRVHGAP